jgi:hypothetical protein
LRRYKEEIERLNQDIQEMMDEIDRLKTFEPPEKMDENKVGRYRLTLSNPR